MYLGDSLPSTFTSIVQWLRVCSTITAGLEASCAIEFSLFEGFATQNRLSLIVIMTSIRDLYIQLGFYPADLQGEILHPVTRLPRLAHTRHCDAWLRGGLDSLLEHMNDFVEEHVEAKYNDTWLFKDGVHEWRFSRRTSIADIVRVTQIFLKQDRRADFFWGNGWGNGWGERKRPYQGPSWPRDKEL